MDPVIYVYFDLNGNPSFPGNCALRSFKNASVAIDPAIQVKPIFAEQILANDSPLDSAAILCIPGGASSPIAKKLNGAGNKKIRQFVENGGTFYGICAGAYYGSSELTFRYKGEPLMRNTHELSFFTGICEGPIPELGVPEYDPAGARSLRVVNVHCAQSGEQFRDIYWGGPRFRMDGKNPNVTVLYSYDDLPNDNAAAISIAIGKGRAILTGIHTEITPTDVQKNAREQLPASEYDAAAIDALFNPPLRRVDLIQQVIRDAVASSKPAATHARPSLRHEKPASFSSIVTNIGTNFVL